MKKLFSKIRVFYNKIKWFIRRKFNQLKSHIRFFVIKTFDKISRKTHREAKKQLAQDFFKDYLQLESYDIDLRLDVEHEKINETIIKKIKENKLQALKAENLDLYDQAITLITKEEDRLQTIYEQRYVLAKEMFDKILILEYEADQNIRSIEHEKNFHVDEIEDIRIEKGRAVNNLKIEYHKLSKEILLKNPPLKIDNQIVKNVVETKLLQKAKKGIPESRKRIETKDRLRINTKTLLQAILYLAPALIFLFVFTFYPIVNAFRLVVYENYNEAQGVYQGFTLFGNFQKVLSDANFIIPGKNVKSSAMINTLLIVVITVPISIIISLLISVLLNSIKKLSNVFQTIFFLPYVTNSLAVGLVFAYMFQTNGLFNKFLTVFNIDGGSWVQHGAEYWKAMFVLLLFSIWNGLAFKIMVFLSAIQGIDKQYYQAASIDATPRFKQFRRITAPLISPTILYIVITSVIGAFKSYSSVIAIFGNSGRPAGAPYHLKTIVFYIYDYFNYSGKMPEAAAASIVLFGIILLMTLIQMQVSKKRVHY